MEISKISIFLHEENLKIEKKKINDVLSLLVPKFIKELMYQGLINNLLLLLKKYYLNKGNSIISEDQTNVVVLFCDICEFEKIVAQEQVNLIRILDSLFRIFDQLCLKNSVQKIETVGKTYMACAGLKECEMDFKLDRSYSRNCANRVINLALDMIKYSRHYTWGEKGTPISLKIGIHNGPVIAGVIGFHKPQFSLIGDTINTTSRVTSTSEADKVTISESVFDIIIKNASEFNLVQRKVEVNI